MSGKTIVGFGDAALPYAEFTLRPGDTRPVVVSIRKEENGAYDLSWTAGNADDCMEMSIVAGLVAEASRALASVRNMHAVFKAEEAARQDDELPF